MNKPIRGYGNPEIDAAEEDRQRRHHLKRVNVAREEGDAQLSQTMYDPDTFVLGTKYAESFRSKHQRDVKKKT